jgi:hypothetical protein
MESITNTVDTGSSTSQTGSDPIEATSDLVDSGKVPINQITPTARIAEPHNFAYFLRSKLPAKNAITARSQLAAIGMAARWQG